MNVICLFKKIDFLTLSNKNISLILKLLRLELLCILNCDMIFVFLTILSFFLVFFSKEGDSLETMLVRTSIFLTISFEKVGEALDKNVCNKVKNINLHKRSAKCL